MTTTKHPTHQTRHVELHAAQIVDLGKFTDPSQRHATTSDGFDVMVAAGAKIGDYVVTMATPNGEQIVLMHRDQFDAAYEEIPAAQDDFPLPPVAHLDV